MNRMKKFWENLEINHLLHPFPAIGVIIAIIWVVYFITLLYSPIYDILAHKTNNPFGFFTNMWIHDLDDQGYHILNNTIGIIAFGYIVSIQTSRKCMIIFYLLSGILTSFFLGIFADFMNITLSERYITWATALGVTIVGDFRLFSIGGGGASDAIMGLLGFAFVLACYSLILFGARIVKYLHPLNIESLGRILKENWLILIVNFVAIVLGLLMFYERLTADFLMFTYSLTIHYAFMGEVGIPFPTSRGHPLLAHVFGAFFGFLLGLMYLIFQKSKSQNITTIGRGV